MNIYTSQHSDEHTYYPLVISKSPSGWMLLAGDNRGLSGNGQNFYYPSVATYSFAEDFTLTFHIADPAQPYDETYILQNNYYELAGPSEPNH